MSRKLLAGTLLAGAAVLGVTLGLGYPKTGPMYSFSVSRYLAHPVYDESVHVTGILVHGSLCQTGECGYRFSLREADQQLPVRYDQCVTPDTFRDDPSLDIMVTVEGERCQGCHDFQASQIMAKCPAVYRMYEDGGPHSRLPAQPIPRCKPIL